MPATTPNKSVPAERRAFTMDEACAALRLGRTTLYALIRDGQLHTVRIGKRRLVPAGEITRLLDFGKAA